MPIAQRLLFHIPSLALAFWVVAVAILFAILGLVIVRCFVKPHQLKGHHEVAGPLLEALAAVYAVLLAFVVITVWQNYDKSNSNAQQEANYLADVYRYSEGLSPSFHKQVERLLNEYRRSIVESEWKTMTAGKANPETEQLIREIWKLYISYEPVGTVQHIYFEESVKKLTESRELRRQRLMDAHTGIHPLLWVILIVGGVALISFTFLFGTENLPAQILMGTSIALLVSLILYTVLVLDFPFTGNVSISAEPFKQIILNNEAVVF